MLEMYALIGRRQDLTSNQDRLLDHHQMCPDDSGEVLVVRVENQGCAQWGIRVADLQQDDPPVVMQVDGGGWILHAPRRSLACLEMVLFESLFGGHDADEDTYQVWEADDQGFAALAGSYCRVPVPQLPPWTGADIRWYAGPDILVRDEC